MVVVDGDYAVVVDGIGAVVDVVVDDAGVDVVVVVEDDAGLEVKSNLISYVEPLSPLNEY